MDQKDLDRELVDTEIARYKGTDFLYQTWLNDEEIEVDVIAETYLDAEIDEHVENTYVEGTVEKLGSIYAWSETGHRGDKTEASIVNYNGEFSPETRELEDSHKALELEHILEAAFNGRENMD